MTPSSDLPLASSVGNTPVVSVPSLASSSEPSGILAKLEFLNPFGSIKDRAAVAFAQHHLISTQQQQQQLTHDTTLVIPSSGNFAFSLCSLVASLPADIRPRKMICILPERTSEEMKQALKSVGAEIVRSLDGAPADAPESGVQIAERMANELPAPVLIVDECAAVKSNVIEKCYEAMADEILKQTDGKLDAIVVGVETGRSVSGLSAALKKVLPNVDVIGVEPSNSCISDSIEMDGTSTTAVTATTTTGRTWMIEDIGHVHAAPSLNPAAVDMWIKVSDQVAYSVARRLIRRGIHCGPSSGAVIAAAQNYTRAVNASAKVLAVLNDSARRYSSTLLNDEWLLGHDLMDAEFADSVRFDLIDQYRAASVEDLQLPAAVAIPTTANVEQAMDLMLSREFSQLPVIEPTTRKLIGYISQGALRSHLDRGNAQLDDPVTTWMYRFGAGKRPRTSSSEGTTTPQPVLARRPRAAIQEYKVITPETPLSELARFFETHSVGFVTDADRRFCLAVVTKYDLLKFLSRRSAALGI
ncbi:tryptophan synthase beta subunit-like PLP-dependent enzyme [Ramicandelaber brevisporus]|nr:tryptophan synthase beta subunit-like PLP-dependent enzyme [Ramicandelaber brevisporus]